MNSTKLDPTTVKYPTDIDQESTKIPANADHSPVIGTTEKTGKCNTDLTWPHAIIPSLVIFFSGILLIILIRLLFRAFKKISNRKKAKKYRSTNGQKLTAAEKVAAFVSNRTDSQFGNDPYSDEEEDVEEDDDDDDNHKRKKGIKNLLTRFKLFCMKFISAQSTWGKILISLSCIFSVISLIDYIVDASQGLRSIEKDYLRAVNAIDIIDIICNLFFLLHFLIRFIAANDKLKFWIELTSIVDMFTVPPIVTAICMKRQWIGLRFICVFRLLNFSDVLQSLYLLRTTNHIRLVELFSLFMCVWIGSGGFIYLVENSGDPFYCYDNPNIMTFWESMYLVIITMSSVGYGDIYCTTTIGRIFIIIFIFGAIALFASAVPEIFGIVNSSRRKYMTEYKKELGIRHLIVGGHISFGTVTNFVRNFSHNDRLNQNLKSVILDEDEPSLELDSLFKRYYNQIVFVQGSMMIIKDLKRARLARAEAVLILTNQSTVCADTEDTKNIMRAIAVKNCCPTTRIILQLLKVENKTICKNLPFWTTNDHIICFTEMKMGFMAAGCLAPGFCTFLSNLLLMFSYDKKASNLIEWHNEYLKGAEMEVYTKKFSPFFHNRPVPEVVNFCYTKLRLLLVAVAEGSDHKSDDHSKIILNPGKHISIGPQTVGFFISANESQAQLAQEYCLRCHCNVPAYSMKRCSCTSPNTSYKLLLKAEEQHNARDEPDDPEPVESNIQITVENYSSLSSLNSKTTDTLDISPDVQPVQEPPTSPPHPATPPSSSSSPSPSPTPFQQQQQQQQHSQPSSRPPSPPQPLKSLWQLFSPSQQPQSQSPSQPKPPFVFLPIPGESLPASPSDNMGACEEDKEMFDITGYFFWTPAKELDDCLLSNAKNRHIPDRLKGHIILCLSHHSQGSLRSFILPLRSSSLMISQLHTIVIVVESKMLLEQEWHTISNFPKIFVKIGSPLNRGVLRSIFIEKCHMCVVHSAQTSLAAVGATTVAAAADTRGMATYQDDYKALLITLNIKNMSFESVSTKYNSSAFDMLHKLFYTRKGSRLSSFNLNIGNGLKSSASIPILTELMNDENVQFIDQDDEDDPDTPFHLTQPFACGRAFASRVLDALSTTIIFNPETYNLIRVFVTGTDSEEHDFLLAEGFTEQSYQLSLEKLNSIRNRSRLNILPVNKGILKEFQNDTFEYMFTKSLFNHNILCLGIYRLINATDPNNRFVIANPSPNMQLLSSDQVYCICPHMLFE